MHTITKLITRLSLLFAMIPLLADSEPLSPVWQALPPETVATLRVPHGNNYLEAIRKTQFGQHFFHEDRIATYLEILARELGEDWTEMQEDLGRFALEPKDLPKLLLGESGIGLVMEKNPTDAKPVLYLMVWLEPGEELAEKFTTAFLELQLDEEKETEITRVDFTLEGHAVHHLAYPQKAQTDDGESVVTHNAHFLLHRMGGRLLAALTLLSGPDFDGTPESLRPPSSEPSQRMQALFARFLQAQASGEGGFAQKIQANPAIQQAIPEGIPGWEIVVDLEQIVATAADQIDDPEFTQMMDLFGFSNLGVAMMQGSIDQYIGRAGGILTTPTPPRGLIATFANQRPLNPRPPAWIPSYVTDYSHLSLNLGDLYAFIRAVVLEVGDESGAQNLSMVEMQTQGMLQTDIQSLLASLGQQHTILTLPADPSTTVDIMEESQDRIALLWSPQDHELWQRAMNVIGMFAPAMQGMLQPAEEQGFEGWRLDMEQFQGGLFLGEENLVFGFGRGTLEELFRAIRNPPEGDNALLTSSHFSQVEDLLQWRPGIFFGVQNLSTQMTEAIRMILGALDLEVDSEDPELSPQSVEQLREILDPDAIGAAFGMAANQVYVTPDGFIIEGASLFTPVEETATPEPEEE